MNVKGNTAIINCSILMNFNICKNQYSHGVSIHFAPYCVQFQHPVLFQTMRCDSGVLDMTGMLWVGVLNVITVRVMTDRADYLAGETVVISGYKYRPGA